MQAGLAPIANVLLATKHGERLPMTAVALVRLFLLHLLPTRFFRIRHYGILSPRVAVESLARARASLEEQGVSAAAPVSPSAGEHWIETTLRVTGVDLRVCVRCEGPVERIPFSNAAHERALRARLDELDRLRAGRAPP